MLEELWKNAGCLVDGSQDTSNHPWAELAAVGTVR